jgi:hypothetical protein
LFSYPHLRNDLQDLLHNNKALLTDHLLHQVLLLF